MSEEQLIRDNSGRLTTSAFRFPKLLYRFVAWKIAKKYNLKKLGSPLKGVDEIAQSYANENYNISIEWDIWTGLTVVALDEVSEDLIKEIDCYLEEKYRI